MNLFHLGLALLMLVTGSINTLSVKWADTMTSESTDGKLRGFDHPFLQACGMFLGEMMCMVVFFVVRWRKRRGGVDDAFTRPSNFSPFVFLPPAMCDMTATSIQYIGLTLTYASSFQMLRGAVIIFTGLFSRIFLRRRLGPLKWVGIAFVIVGLATVGICDMIYSNNGGGGHKNDTTLLQLSPGQSDANSTLPLFHREYFGPTIRGGNPDDPASPFALAGHSFYRLLGSEANRSSSDIILGDVLIVCAQVIVATQMVYEEKFISKYDVPALQAVGWEGTFGFVTLSALLLPMYFIPVGAKFGNNPRHVLEDAYDGLFQLAHNPLLLTAFCGTVVSIAFFNFAGISVTKEMSATTRMVLDSVRTLVIWGVSLAVGWQTFHWLQLLGFAILVTGMCIYNDIVIAPAIRWLLVKLGLSAGDPYSNLDDDVRRQLNQEEDDDEQVQDQDDVDSGAERRKRVRREAGGDSAANQDEGETAPGVAYRPE